MNPRDRSLQRPQTTSKPLPQSVLQIPQSKQRDVKRKPGRSSGWAIATIFIAIGGLAGAGWLGLQLMVTPQTLLWINRFMPAWIPIPITG